LPICPKAGFARPMPSPDSAALANSGLRVEPHFRHLFGESRGSGVVGPQRCIHLLYVHRLSLAVRAEGLRRSSPPPRPNLTTSHITISSPIRENHGRTAGGPAHRSQGRCRRRRTTLKDLITRSLRREIGMDRSNLDKSDSPFVAGPLGLPVLKSTGMKLSAEDYAALVKRIEAEDIARHWLR
jgi:hypothetical protein